MSRPVWNPATPTLDERQLRPGTSGAQDGRSNGLNRRRAGRPRARQTGPQ